MLFLILVVLRFVSISWQAHLPKLKNFGKAEVIVRANETCLVTASCLSFLVAPLLSFFSGGWWLRNI